MNNELLHYKYRLEFEFLYDIFQLKGHICYEKMTKVEIESGIAIDC